MKMTKIEKLWIELENDKSSSNGLLIRRYSKDVIPDIYVAVRSSESFRCIAISLTNTKDLNLSLFSNLRDISVEVIPNEQKSESSFLVFQLLNNELREIFSILCEDLILSVSLLTSEVKIIKELINRFEKWDSLFEKVSSHGLTPEEQRGLFGELFLLKKLLRFFNNSSVILSSWVGVEKNVRDFQYSNWGIEVKTTQGNNHQRVHISNERQLDTRSVENLFLFHLSIDFVSNAGETINTLVDSIRLLLHDDYYSLSKFNCKLVEAGYFENHRTYYFDKGYIIRNEKYYKVEKDFPRIEEKDIRNGVGDVKYSIITSQCLDYVKLEEEVFHYIILK